MNTCTPLFADAHIPIRQRMKYFKNLTEYYGFDMMTLMT